MFKKLLVLLACLFIASQVFAGTDNKTIIDATLIDDDPTSATSDTIYLQDYKKVAFFVDYDETEVENSISGAVTMQVSYDGTNWLSASFYDYGGGATLQTSETISSDGWYYCWFNPDLEVPFTRLIVTGTNTDTNDTISLSAYLVGEK